MRRANLIAAIAASVAVGLGALAPAAVAHKLTYSVSFSIASGKFRARETSNDPNNINTRNENDEFSGPSAIYRGLKIPSKGPAPAHILIQGNSTLLPSESSWETFGDGYASNGHSASYDCKGHLAVVDKRQTYLISGAGSGRAALKLHIQASAAPLKVIDSAGEDALVGDSCSDFNGDWGFYPASDRVSPEKAAEMLTVHMNVPLKQLRRLKKNGHLQIKVTESGADYRPPSDCSAGKTTCTERLDWTGVVVFRRTG